MKSCTMFFDIPLHGITKLYFAEPLHIYIANNYVWQVFLDCFKTFFAVFYLMHDEIRPENFVDIVSHLLIYSG